MIRTALRLATLAACTNAGVTPYPTLALDSYYDSKTDDADILENGTRAPMVTIRTDEDTHVFQRRRFITLKLEIETFSGGKGDTIITPETSPEVEAQIDLLEYQINSALFGYSSWAMFWRSLWGDYTEYSSVPLYSQTENGLVRMAAREITLIINSPVECPPEPIDARDAPLNSAGEHIPPPAVLPKRLLDTFTKIDMEGFGDFKIVAAQLKDFLQSQPLQQSQLFPAFLGVRMHLPKDFQSTGDNVNSTLSAELLGDIPVST